MILCPCKKCGNIYWHFREVVYEHLVVDGFIRGYKKWIFHGECTSSGTSSTINPTYPDTDYHHQYVRQDDMEDMLRDAFNMRSHGEQSFPPDFIISEDCNITGNVFCETGTSSCQDMKRLIKDLGLGYDKIHSCPNDCMLYWGDQKNQQSCHLCGKSRWMNSNTEDVNTDEGGAQLRKKPVKVLRYFPLILRLQRLFMSSKTAESMTWHNDQWTDDGLLKHPADSLAWKSFDSKFPSFASDPRNVRLGLAADGFNPFKIMSTSYSTWPVVLVPYNLPPWICMKQSSFILSMIIPGEKGPENDIDIYLQPLIEELKQLWSGVETYNVLRKENFNLRAALLWTINDFSAYANLSGWSTKGRYACPCCAAQTCSKWLYNGKKFSYMGHRRWLDENHKFRFQRTLFDGTEEYRGAPEQTVGSEILFMLKDINFSYGKMNQPPTTQTRRRSRDESDDESDEEDDPNEAEMWKKRSIFFELPYWKHNILRHNLDVMNIEKNVCENIIGTILNVDGKSKDNLQSRLDLVDMRIRRDLHPQILPNGKYRLPPSIFSMSKKEKEVFCMVLKDIKVPDAYASNISRCVSFKDRRLYSLKSHDYHILMQDLLPIALRCCMSKNVTSCIIELSNIMKAICGKVLNVEELEKVQDRATLTLYNLEKIFPHSFFTIMVHLVIHLPHEAILGGPSYCRNKRYPEGSIAEGYLAEECMTFCSRYLEDAETRLNRPSRNAGLNDHDLAETYLFQSYGEPIGKVEIVELDDISWIQAHRYVLFHHDSMEPLRNEYKQILRSRARSRRLQHREINKLFTESFHEWLSQTVWSGKDVNDEIKWLSQGPNKVIKRYSAFLINGYRFHTKYRKRMRRTQNCRVVVNSSITSYASARDSNPVEGNVEYYGLLTDIIELDYYGRWKVILFRCDWDDVNTARGIKKDQFGFTMVNFSRLIHTGQQLMDKPYVFSSQVKQVFYSKDPTDEGWYVVLRNTPRDLFDMGNGSRDDIVERSETLPFPEQNLDENIPSTRKMRRRRLRGLSIVQNTLNSEEGNSEQQTAVGSSNVPETLDEPEEFQTENGGTRRVRGRTLLSDLYDLDPANRVKVSRNTYGQPVGSEARLLAGYIGILARNANMLPINYESWHHMPDSNKNQALANIKVSDDYIKKTLGKKRRDNKSILKKQYFKKDISLEEKLRNVPPGMLRYQWEDAVRFWNSKKGEDRERVGISSRQKQKFTHTAGSRSFASVAEAEEVKSGQKVGRLQLFEITHKKKDGSPMTSEAGEIMEKLKDKKVEYKATASTDSSVNLENIDNRIITEVLGPERYGRVRFQGSGVTPTQYFGSGSQQYMPSGSQAKAEVQRLRDQMAQMQANTVEQIAEVQRKYEELQQQLRAEAAAAAREAEHRKKYDDLQLQLQQMMQMFQQSQKPPS
ncbi:hypothetical protein CXB51_010896 [Gossypium anomalum]|uniref:Transposase n=1 Tax=Gossypium anomalum TaxID=47600 RepID=A0A8J6D703_9ROSI|nr:hypothetical protein CXB51_010896 [Gossypium anomalum]